MGFKLKPSYVIDNTPIYRVNDENGVVGRATKSGVILIKPQREGERQVGHYNWVAWDQIGNICGAL